MKFRQLIEYNMRNIFLEKPYTKCVGETIPRPFSKKVAFILCQAEGYQSILKLSCRPVAFTSCNAAVKQQKEIWD